MTLFLPCFIVGAIIGALVALVANNWRWAKHIDCDGRERL